MSFSLAHYTITKVLCIGIFSCTASKASMIAPLIATLIALQIAVLIALLVTIVMALLLIALLVFWFLVKGMVDDACKLHS